MLNKSILGLALLSVFFSSIISCVKSQPESKTSPTQEVFAQDLSCFPAPSCEIQPAGFTLSK